MLLARHSITVEVICVSCQARHPDYPASFAIRTEFDVNILYTGQTRLRI